MTTLRDHAKRFANEGRESGRFAKLERDARGAGRMNDQAERREVLRNDTMLSRQQNTIDEAGGRYTRLAPISVMGAASAEVPQQPPSSSWAKSLRRR